ncbi:endonuclease [Photobacterium sanctipauli]|uniref:Endonuclease n=1 Tax=Photobacterium sanctipauli TaxID=1342794 RepID=A0A2T3NVD9_9GAMM|nr:endonuclease/exonuclease/phosphatase family protein [Photobacterium sanctipauli]PSW20246.1 endonuclease [Photobacterium sanctipauli]
MIKSKLALFTSLIFCHPALANSDVLIDGPVETDTIRVASYNIMASRMGDTSAIKDAVKAIDADIIALQEVDNMTVRSGKNFSSTGSDAINQAEYIATELGMHYAYCKTIDFDGGAYGHAILSKHPVTMVKQLDLPNQDNKEQRSACAIEVDVPNYPAPIMAVTAHLDHSDTDLRLSQVRFLNDNFSYWKFKSAIPVLFGDMNLPPQSHEYFELQQWFKETDKQLQYTAPAWNPDRKIDYILTSTAQEWDIQSATVPKATDTPVNIPWYKISDHLPVIVDMKLTEK